VKEEYNESISKPIHALLFSMDTKCLFRGSYRMLNNFKTIFLLQNGELSISVAGLERYILELPILVPVTPCVYVCTYTRAEPIFIHCDLQDRFCTAFTPYYILFNGYADFFL
jgi:hypothetical protein